MSSTIMSKIENKKPPTSYSTQLTEINYSSSTDNDDISNLVKTAHEMNANSFPHTLLQSNDFTENISFCHLFRTNAIYVLTYCLVFGSFGVCVGFLGPTVFDLGCQTNSDQKQMNWVFFVQLIMSLMGSISAGFLSKL